MTEKDTAFRKGENIKIVASNRPWIDMTVPPESNDFRNVDSANIKLYDPCDELIIDFEMCEMPGKVGWYYFDFQTNEDHKPGLWRSVITFTCADLSACTQPTTSTASTATSSSSGSSTDISSVSVNFFRLLDERMF